MILLACVIGVAWLLSTAPFYHANIFSSNFLFIILFILFIFCCCFKGGWTEVISLVFAPLIHSQEINPHNGISDNLTNIFSSVMGISGIRTTEVLNQAICII